MTLLLSVSVVLLLVIAGVTYAVARAGRILRQEDPLRPRRDWWDDE